MGLAASLVAHGVPFDFIASDALESPELRAEPLVRFLNLRGDTAATASPAAKMWRVARFYVRLLIYAATAKPRVFHILWNNKLEYLDRTVLLLFYKLLGKRLVHTVHNVNVRKRDGHDSLLNRVTLRFQYHTVDHLFVHTRQMLDELQAEFAVPPEKISLIPFGINNTVPNTALTRAAARTRLGLTATEKVVLFFGNIAPYKGLEYLIDAMTLGTAAAVECRLLVAGRLKCSTEYWAAIERRIERGGLGARVVLRIEFVPDEETEVYFKAADVLALPYTHVFQSGVLFLGYSFGLPVLAADVGSLREDVVDNQTGRIFAPRDPSALAHAIDEYFGSDLYTDLDKRRVAIQQLANDRYSWTTVAAITVAVYSTLAAIASRTAPGEGLSTR